jgi:molecular chaperone DnaK
VTPSVVAFTDDGQRVAGPVAKRQATMNTRAPVYSAKRFIGRRWSEVDEVILVCGSTRTPAVQALA